MVTDSDHVKAVEKQMWSSCENPAQVIFFLVIFFFLLFCAHSTQLKLFYLV